MKYIDPCLLSINMSKSEIISVQIDHQSGNYIKRCSVETISTYPPDEINIEYAGYNLFRGKLSGITRNKCGTTTAYYMSNGRLLTHQNEIPGRITILPKEYLEMVKFQLLQAGGFREEYYFAEVYLGDTYYFDGSYWANLPNFTADTEAKFNVARVSGQYAGIGLWIIVRDARYSSRVEVYPGVTVPGNAVYAKVSQLFSGYYKVLAHGFNTICDTLDDLIKLIMKEGGVSDLKINIDNLQLTVATQVNIIPGENISDKIVSLLSPLSPVIYADDDGTKYILTDPHRIAGTINIPVSFIRNMSITESNENLPGYVRLKRGEDSYMQYLMAGGIVTKAPEVIIPTGIPSSLVEFHQVPYGKNTNELTFIAQKKARWYFYAQKKGTITTIAPLPKILPYTFINIGGETFLCSGYSHHISQNDAYTTINIGV